MSKLADWLGQKYLQWQLSTGKRRTVLDFAEYLEVPQPSLSEWMSDKYLPRGRTIAKLAEKLGYEIYDVLDMPRPLPAEISPMVAKLVRSADKLPEGVQNRVLAAIDEIAPLITEHNITNNEEIMWILTDTLRNHLDPSAKPERLASMLAGHPRIAYPIGIGFSFEHTRENIRRFKQTGMEAAVKIDTLGLDEDSEEGQKAILQVFLDAGFSLLNTTGMNFNRDD